MTRLDEIERYCREDTPYTFDCKCFRCRARTDLPWAIEMLRRADSVLGETKRRCERWGKSTEEIGGFLRDLRGTDE